MADVKTLKIPNSSGTLVSYAIKDVRNKRTRRNISSDLANLTPAIAEQNLEKYGYEIGDYFDGPSSAVDGTNYTYRYTLADPDTFYGGYTSYAVLGTHHATVVVDTGANVQWNTSANTDTGYVGSNLHSYLVDKVLPKVKSDFTSLFGDWSTHLIPHSKLYRTNNNRWGWGWSNDQYISALTSVQIHGAAICDMDGTDTGEGNKPLAVFQQYFYPEILGNQNNWLRSVSAAGYPCIAANGGFATGSFSAAASFGAVGLIIFK